MKKNNTLTKREFIKRSLFGVAGAGVMAAGLHRFRLFANTSAASTASGISPQDTEIWKWSKEAEFYTQTPRGVRCRLCPNECTINNRGIGDCRTRINIEDKLYSIAYGNPCAVHTDPIEKKPLYHFYPTTNAFSIATAGCNLACLNCQNWTISQKSPKETQNIDLMPPKVVQRAIKENCKSIAYTYSEPIVFYEYTYDTAKIARDNGIKNVLVSAGYINEKPLRKFCNYIDAANIDLKSFDDEIYMKLNAGALQPVLNSLKILKQEGVWLEITNLVVPNWTDDLDMIKKMCNWLAENGFEDNPLHFSRFHPMYKLTQLPPTPVTTLEKAKKIAQKAGLNYVYIGNVPGIDGANTHCPKCGKLLIKRRGFYITENNMVEGKCKFCKTSIAGRW